jgi:acetamidase/formamidase
MVLTGKNLHGITVAPLTSPFAGHSVTAHSFHTMEVPMQLKGYFPPLLLGGLLSLTIALEPTDAKPDATHPDDSSRSKEKHPDWFVPSRPETVTWGWILVDKDPVLRIKSGDTVRIDTLSHHGATQTDHPVTFLGQFGVAPEDVLPDVIDFWSTRAQQPTGAGRGPHILTGPIFIEDSEPGDTLEIQVLDIKLRVPYGINNTGPNSGVLALSYPGSLAGDPVASGGRKLIQTKKERGRTVALFSDDIHVEVAPFMGTMGVAPPIPIPGPPVGAPMQSSRPPGVFGGNLDLKDLTEGSTLFLPVFHDGALFYTGDGHSLQGDGEVDGTAIEHSLTPTLRFVLHKGKTITAPRAETRTHYIVMGIDVDLDRAMRLAVQESVNFMVAEKGLTAGDAYALASLAWNYHVAEAVNLTQVIVGKIPKRVFDRKRVSKGDNDDR